MKRYLSLFFIVSLFMTLFGCITTNPLSTTSTATDPLSEDVTTYTKEIVPFVNFSTEFVKTFGPTDLSLYYYPQKLGIPYVDISEFVTLLLGIIDENIQVESSVSIVTVSLEYLYTEAEKAEFGITEDSFLTEVTFDFESMTVEATSIDSFDAFSGETETDFSSGLEMIDFTEEPLPRFLANVSEYGFFFRALDTENGIVHTIPLSLANLFLTGSMFDVVHNGDTLYGLDTYQIGSVRNQDSPLYAAVVKNTDATTKTMKTESLNFLAFVFDYFYGLKEYREIMDFSTYLDDYFSAIRLFEYSLYAFTDSLEDMHTAVISPGQINPTYHYYANNDYPDYLYDWIYDYYGCECDTFNGFNLEIVEDMAYFRIESFTTDFSTDIAPYMETIRAANVDHVVIDLTCNGGGVLAGVFHLLNYLTNEPISFYNTTLGMRSSQTYDVAGDLAINADFYIVTSEATYSAANLFTALAVEEGLAITIGSDTGGGACSVMAVVLPNGAILQMSSNMNLTFSTYESVEEGVIAEYPIDWKTLYLNNTPYYSPDDFYTIIRIF